MRNMSFMLTKQQIRNKTKLVTRRLGWWFLNPGDMVMACEKCQGLKPGEGIVRIRPIKIVSIEAWELRCITLGDVAREGFPHMTCDDFIEMFCREMKCKPETPVNRIEFEYLPIAEELEIMAGFEGKKNA